MPNPEAGVVRSGASHPPAISPAPHAGGLCFRLLFSWRYLELTFNHFIETVEHSTFAADNLRRRMFELQMQFRRRRHRKWMKWLDRLGAEQMWMYRKWQLGVLEISDQFLEVATWWDMVRGIWWFFYYGHDHLDPMLRMCYVKNGKVRPGL